MGLMFGIIYGVYGLGLWFGVKIIKDEEQDPDFQTCALKCASQVLGSTIPISQAISSYQIGAHFEALDECLLVAV